MGGRIQNGFSARYSAPQDTGVFTDIRSKNITAVLPHCLPAAYFRDLFCGSIKGCDAPL
jgi:hypothetical protein